MDRVKHPIVYLPVEFRSREFDSKALLAARLAELGYPAVLGQQWMLYANLDRLPAGVVLFKSFNRLHQPAMLQARRAGHRVVAMEEELLAQAEEKAVATLCADGIFDAVDLLLAQGQFEYDVLKRVGGERARVEITGNGRIDLLKPGARSFFGRQIDDLRRRFGDFVLVNTNFSTVNSIWLSVEKVTETEIAAGFLDRRDDAAMGRWRNFIAYEEANRAAMHAAIRQLSRSRPSQSIVVRPHPGENLKGWEGVFADCRNVHVVREGSHVPWTLACRVLLHTSCTTGFEAYIAGQPALSLVPSRGWTSDSLLSNEVNPVFADPLQLVAAAEKILDGGGAPPPPPPGRAPQRYIWNLGEEEGSRRSAELLVAGLPGPGPLALPALQNIARDDTLRAKFSMPAEECAETLQRLCDTFRIPLRMRVEALGDSLFLVAPPAVAPAIVISPPMPEYAQLRAEIESACQGGNFQKAYDSFKQNYAEAHRHADLCFFTGVALFELGKPALALQYFQSAALAGGPALDANISIWLARTHHRLGEMELARMYAEQAYRQVPMEQGFFDFFKELGLRTGKEVPEHWVVIGCSHVRYFRFMQMNQLKFFKGRVHLECYEFGGATAYGLGNPASRAGALQTTRQLRPRMAQADRVVLHFGEVDCRRAAWKAAAVSGRTIEEAIGESVAQLENYVRREVLPHNRNVLLFGAKPQIVGDEDFYKVAAADEERIVFKPLAERERITGLFNVQVREAGARLKVDYADFHHVLADEKSRRQFFRKVYWDGYTTDTHGNVDYLATLYFQSLQEFAPHS